MPQDESIRAHVFARPGLGPELGQRLLPLQPAAARLAGQQEVGRTDHFIIFTDGTPDGNASAQAVLQSAEADFGAIQAWFGGLQLPPGQEGDDQTTVRTALPMQVAMDSQAGGAYHYACDGTDIFIEPVPAVAGGLLVAEVVEVFEAAQAGGWDCGRTNGEGLSRVLAFERYPALAQDFLDTEQYWWSHGHADYVNTNDAGDTDEASNGCATLFLFYLHSQLNYTWDQIVATAGPTLGATYQRLTGVDPQSGFQDFVLRLQTLDNGSGQLTLPPSGNPFPLNQQAPQSSGASSDAAAPGDATPPSQPASAGAPQWPTTPTRPTTTARGTIMAIIGLIIVIAVAYYVFSH